jgi:hypothetical protein
VPENPENARDLSASEIERVRSVLQSRFPVVDKALGSQLGAIIRPLLDNPDIKARFGGLKPLLSRYFETDVVWQGRHGLDDIFEINFSRLNLEGTTSLWESLDPNPSPWLWPAVTNPTVKVQFAWSASDGQLMKGPLTASLPENSKALRKLTRDDYSEMAIGFLRSGAEADSVRDLLEIVETQGLTPGFQDRLKQRGLVGKWEQFRVQSAVALFGTRLREVGMSDEQVGRWTSCLSRSREMSRAQSESRGAALAAVSVSREPRATPARTLLPDPRQIAMKAVASLSDFELNELRLPFGLVMKAIKDLTGE